MAVRTRRSDRRSTFWLWVSSLRLPWQIPTQGHLPANTRLPARQQARHEDRAPHVNGVPKESARLVTRILVVEDEMIVAMDLQHTLERMGYMVVGIACSGRDAIRQANITRPDIILMDIHLNEDMDGIEATRQIQSQHQDMSVIYVTAQSDEHTLQRARETAPCDLLIKPFDDRLLRAALDAALSPPDN